MSEAGLQGSELRLKWRYLKDALARYGVAVGGLGVIAAVMLIFFYLFYVVIPLFLPAEIRSLEQVDRGGSSSRSLYSAVEEQAEVAFHVTENGELVFFEVATGNVRHQEQLDMALQPVESAEPNTGLSLPASGIPGRQAERLNPVQSDPLKPAMVKITTVTPVDEDKGILALGTDHGDVLIIQHEYKISFPDDVRLITPRINFPYGKAWLKFADKKVEKLAVRENQDLLLISGYLENGSLLLMPYTRSSSLFDDEAILEPVAAIDLNVPLNVDHLIMDPLMEWLYAAADDGRVAYYSIRDLDDGPELLDVVELTPSGVKLTALAMLSGGISLVAGDEVGGLDQWFPVRDENNEYHLRHVRDFEPMGSFPISEIEAESGRRGFIVTDDQGSIGVYYSTSGRRVMTLASDAGRLRNLAVAPRSDLLIAETGRGRILPIKLHNEHPEISWSALWGKVWYESYPEEDFVWQSSSASNDFEPKFSLVPLSFGTLKAAFYAMLFAMPLAIMGAIYTAYFMAPEMRQMVKPTVEVMEALPTVILGFLAGLWLAPMVEQNLPGIFTLLIFLPLAMLVAAYLWSRLPRSIRHRVPDGWHAALLLPVIVLFTFLCFGLSRPMELWLFNGNMPLWLDREMGISYDQRNSLVVGLAMGFAVIPTIFSIAEDAIFSVPRHLSNGSLALGATPWQTLVRVVLPTASPGIFSSVMIGMGRAVGETMIVLMATGNTPLMDGSPFQGMRTLSANIAVEMPESEVGSTHFRILFLAGLVLFLFTFIFNTLAELVRQRLREKYSNI